MTIWEKLWGKRYISEELEAIIKKVGQKAKAIDLKVPDKVPKKILKIGEDYNGND
jgi:hypothetical protein